jgi:hypothetical protein
MKKLFFISILSISSLRAVAQFSPPAGQPGTTAIHKDSSVFVGWATRCSVVRGLQDLSNKSLIYASAGDSSMALGVAGANAIVSLGDAGYAIVQFDKPISNGPGWDFAVFENSFSDTYLELAYVEVSSDGKNYVRFPCTSNTDTTKQVDGFGDVDATKIDNLAGKYRALYGTPFDLQQLASKEGLDVNAITHVKISDVVGCIQEPYARRDQYGHKINEPWPTPFPASGFDLDAVGVIHSGTTSTKNGFAKELKFNVYPNPVRGSITIQLQLNLTGKVRIVIRDVTGKAQMSMDETQTKGWQQLQLPATSLCPGIYFLSVITEEGSATTKIVVNND